MCFTVVKTQDIVSGCGILHSHEKQENGNNLLAHHVHHNKGHRLNALIYLHSINNSLKLRTLSMPYLVFVFTSGKGLSFLLYELNESVI